MTMTSDDMNPNPGPLSEVNSAGQSMADQQAANGQATPTMQTSTGTATPTPPPQQAQEAPPSPADDHASLYKSFLGVLAGGGRTPTRDANGNPVAGASGQVQTQPSSVKQLGAGILAGALASLAASFQHMPQRNGNGIVESHQNESVQAGAAAAAQQTQDARVKQAQGQVDEQRLRQYTTMKQNYELQSMALTNDRLGDEAKQRTTAAFQPLHDWLTQESVNNPEIQAAIHGDELGHDELLQMLQEDKAHGVKDTAIPSGTRPEIGPDGKPTGRMEQTWMVLANDAKIALTDGLREAYGMKNVPNGTLVPLSVLMKNGINQSVTSGVSDIIKNLGKAQDEAFGGKDKPKHDDVTLASLQKENPWMRSPQVVAKLQMVAGKTPGEAIDTLQKAGDTQLAAVLANKFGISSKDWANKEAADLQTAKDKAMTEEEQLRAQNKANTPEGKAELLHKQLENRKIQEDLDAANNAAMGLKVPDNFKLPPHAVAMDASSLQQNLAQQGVDIPREFQALYAVGHNAADLTRFPSRPVKGQSGMTAPQALSFIRQFVNPQYQEGDYKAAAKLSEELASLKQNTAGGTLYNAGTASQHLELLSQAGDALNNNDTQALNRIANAIGIQAGKSNAVTFQAIADQANQEVAKVVAGGKPNEPEIAALRNQLNTAQSPEQVKGVVRSYIGLMSGRINEINDRSQQYFGRNVKGISPKTREVFKKYGFDTPDDPQAQEKNQSEAIDRKQKMIQSITLPGGGHPADIKFGPAGQVIVWSGKAGDPWIDPSTGKPPAAKQ